MEHVEHVKNSQGRVWWFFTLNFVEITPESHGQIDFAEHPTVEYAKWQLEQGETGNVHFQGVVRLTNTYKRGHVLKIIPRAHWEGVRDVQAALKYVGKADTRLEGPWEYGELPKNCQGKRTDLIAVKELIDAGRREEEIAELHFASWARYHRSFREYAKLKTPPRDFKTCIVLVLGPPGSGKTSYCHRVAAGAYWKNKGNWWDGYSGHYDVIMDEFTGWLPYHDLNRLCDRYPLHWEIKGAHVEFIARRAFFTSNSLPHEWYDFSCMHGDLGAGARAKYWDIRAFARRVDAVLWLGFGQDRRIFLADAFRAAYRYLGEQRPELTFVLEALDYPEPEPHPLAQELTLPPQP